jgi:hypothetical protein
MNPVWVCFPTINADRARESEARWKSRGYKTAIWLEPGLPSVGADFEVQGIYPGYWAACNQLALAAISQASAVVLASDDIYPDETHAPEDIVAECDAKFPDKYWVMQPTGDDKEGMDGVWRICGSPWFGKSWVEQGYMGKGPCPFVGFYRAFYGDEEVFNVAKAQGVLWQRPDLSQFHSHWCRRGGPKRTDYQNANNTNHWEYDKATFFLRMENGFPGSSRLCQKTNTRAMGVVRNPP